MESSLNIEEYKNQKDRLINGNVYMLTDFINNGKLNMPNLKSLGGIYAFWWLGNKKEFSEKLLTCDYKLKGKKTEKDLISIKFTNEWIKGSTTDNKICLYVGKSTDIKGRVSKHLKLQTKNIWGNSSKTTGFKPNSESQLRIGLERVFDKSILDDLLKNIGISWVIIDSYKNGINRFYLEDYFVGKYLPLFNIDIER